MNKFAIGDVLDVSQEFAVYREAIVEDVVTKKNGSVYVKVRGVLADGTLSKRQHDVWEDAAGLKKIHLGVEE
jgi:hypothetical protein